MKLTSKDFDQLTLNSMNWSGHQWEKQSDRFEDLDFENPAPLDYSFLRAYWLERFSDVLFARAFLEAQNYEYRVYFDTADSLYVLVTNYGGAL
jgi:hypothetical protein